MYDRKLLGKFNETYCNELIAKRAFTYGKADRE